ncbi:hypothetical protein BYT27DRAFT_7201503 [Phlegmacium glaucopus]|nr:hypothetical protein BYT27DRAFT_7201503 [Phlegmacium glaucopus]
MTSPTSVQESRQALPISASNSARDQISTFRYCGDYKPEETGNRRIIVRWWIVLLEVVLISAHPLTISQSDYSPNNLTSCNIVANTPTFRTEFAFFSPGNHHSSLIYYPFDSYSAEIFIFAQDTRTNATMGVRLANTRGIISRVRIKYDNTHNHSGFKTNTITRPNVNIPAGMVDIVITISRGMVTLILLLVMITTVLFGFRQKGEVLVIPVATLFAFTQLRQTGFDFVGLLPCLALLSLSAAFTLGALILNDPTDHPLRLSWDL